MQRLLQKERLITGEHDPALGAFFISLWNGSCLRHCVSDGAKLGKIRLASEEANLQINKQSLDAEKQ